jgi:hypothetical protein
VNLAAIRSYGCFGFLFLIFRGITFSMKVSSVLALLAAAVNAANAWTSRTTKRASLSMMASKGASKWEKKKSWLASRGLGEDGLPAGGGAATAASAPMVIIGGGRIGSLLAQGGESTLLGRDDSIDADGTGPILIATRNDALDGIVDACPENRRKDLVFLQNGYLDDFLASKGLLESTQALLYLSVASMGVEPVDGVTSVNPEGLTAATGEHAQAFADRLAALNLKCKVVTPKEYRPAMFEKLMYVSAAFYLFRIYYNRCDDALPINIRSSMLTNYLAGANNVTSLDV